MSEKHTENIWRRSINSLMRVFIDTNVVVDLLAHRAHFYEEAAQIFSLAAEGHLTAFVSPTTFSTTAYLMERAKKKNIAEVLRKFFTLDQIAPMDKGTIEQSIAVDCQFLDIENAMQYYSACHAGCKCIVTRNQMDFRPSSLPVYSPREFLEYCA